MSPRKSVIRDQPDPSSRSPAPNTADLKLASNTTEFALARLQ